MAKSVRVAHVVAVVDKLVEDGEEEKAGVELLNAGHVLSELSQVVHVFKLNGRESGSGTKGDSGSE